MPGLGITIASAAGRGSEEPPPLGVLLGILVGETALAIPLGPFPPRCAPNGALVPDEYVAEDEFSPSRCRLLGTDCDVICELVRTAGVTTPVLTPGTYPCEEFTGVVARGGTDPALGCFRLFS